MEGTTTVQVVEVIAKALIVELKKSLRMDMEEVWLYIMCNNVDCILRLPIMAPYCLII
jgi:hypothetical protein